MSTLSKKMSVLIATFAPFKDGKRLITNGMIEPLTSYLVPKVRKVVFIEQPYPGSDILMPVIERYTNGKKQKNITSSKFLSILYPFLKPFNSDATHITFKIRDFFSVVDYILCHRGQIDVFIGLEAINALAGILLKKLGRIKKVVYYVSDYSPVRYGNTFFNSVYISLDRFCVMHADVTWDVSLAMQPARFTAGLSKSKKYNVVHVPNALFPSQIGKIPIQKRKKNSLVFMGTLDDINGVDLIIESLAEVKKTNPAVTLEIIGGGDKNLVRLKKLVTRLRLEDSIIFYGFVPSNDDMAKIIRRCYIALAPYRSFWGSERWYGDAGKIRSYLANGIPVITSHVPPLGREIVAKNAGIMVKDTKEEFSKAILRLLSDKKLYEMLAINASKISKNNIWEKEYKKAFSTI